MKFNIKVNPYKNKNDFAMNGNSCLSNISLTQYSEQDFLIWFDTILFTLTDQSGEDFDIEIQSETLDFELLKSLQKSFNNHSRDIKLQSVKNKKFDIATSVEERYSIAERLINKYRIDINTSNLRIKTYLDSNINIDETYYREVSNISNAKIIFTKDVNFSKTINNQDTCLVICLSKDNYALPSSNGEKIYFWMIKESEFTKINNAIIDRFYKIKYINYCVEKLRSKISSFSAEDKKLLKQLNSVDEIIEIEDIPNIETGKFYEVKNKNVKMTSSSSNVAYIDGNKIYGNAAGECEIYFYSNNSSMPIDKKIIRVYKENYVTNISLSVDNSRMDAGKTKTISISVSPKNAIDANKIKWSVSNRNVAHISEKGVLTAISGGRVIVTAKTEKVEKSIEIIVDSVIQSIRLQLDNNSNTIRVGDRKYVNVILSPVGVENNDIYWYSSDEDVARVLQGSDGRYYIYGQGYGNNCTITCKARKGGASAQCTVNVEYNTGTFGPSITSFSQTMISFSAFFIFASIMCLIFSFLTGAIIGEIISIAFAIIAIVKDTRRVGWPLLLIAVNIILFIIG